MYVFVCISHTCRNLNFAKNVTTLLHWADDMKCLINSVKNSSSKKKKNPYLPTLFLFSLLRQYNNFLFLALFPRWNSMRFFHEGITLRHELTGRSKIRDSVPAKFKHVRNIVTCTSLWRNVITYVPALWNFQKADFEPYYASKKYTTFSFPIH